MKAVRLHDYKQPPRMEEISQPDLESHGDVLVRVGGAGVCRTDLHLIDGWFEAVMPAERPFTIGHETAGWVEAVRWPAMDRVERKLVATQLTEAAGPARRSGWSGPG